jgi:hypothetical protein
MPHQAEQSSSLHLKQQSIQANASRLIGLIVDTYAHPRLQIPTLSFLNPEFEAEVRWWLK